MKIKCTSRYIKSKTEKKGIKALVFCPEFQQRMRDLVSLM